MENCPLNGMPCPHVKNINIIEIGPNSETSKNLCICCGVAYLGSTLFKNMEPACSCGHTIRDIVFTGRVGCGNCYEYFKKELMPLIEMYQSSLKHKGKVPKNIILTLEEQLKRAVAKEDYETAARLRDEIKLLRQ